MNGLDKCPLCRSINISQKPVAQGADYLMICDRCGSYFVTEEFLLYNTHDFFNENGFILSGLSREMSNSGQKPPVFMYNDGENKSLKHYLILDPLDLDSKIVKLLLNIKKRSKYYGDKIVYSAWNDFPVGYAKNRHEFVNLLKLLDESGYIKLSKPRDKFDVAAEALIKKYEMSLTAKGWQQVSDLEFKNKESEQGFVAIWFDESMADSIDALKTAIKNTGFKPLCISGEHFSESIMDKALGEIRKSRFVVIDLTGGRPSVFFEAGFVFGLNIEAIYVYKKGQDKNKPLDFYVKHYQCHEYESAEHLERIVTDAINARIKK